MQTPQVLHLQATKHILCYMCQYLDLGLFFPKGEETHLHHGYMDTDYGQDVDDKISVGAYIFFLIRRPISWKFKK